MNHKKLLTIAEAKQRLMELANGEYHSMEYTINDHGNGNVSQSCKVYLQKYGFFESAHWHSALDDLEVAMSGGPRLSESVPVSKDTGSSNTSSG